MKWFSIFLGLFLICRTNLSSQDNELMQFGKISLKDFTLAPSLVPDTSAGAVFVAEIGSTHFIGNKYHSFSYVYKKYTRIRILNKKGFDLATIKILLYGKGDRKDQLTAFEAAVYNVENGKVAATRITKDELFEDKLSVSRSVDKVSLPNVKEGSIIEYALTVTSYRSFDIPAWSFQHLGYPSLYSEYEVVFPDAMRFLFTRYGIDSFYSHETSEVRNNRYTMGDMTVISNDVRHRWSMKNIPAFNVESFIYAPLEYVDRIEFSIAQAYNGVDVYNLQTSWEETTKDLLAERFFGLAIEKDNLFNLVNTVEKITSADNNLLVSAKNIYTYIRDDFTCVPDDDIYLSDDLYDINRNKKGTVADVNLLLTGLLRLKGIDADPVVLSTREYGTNSPDYPLLDKMNYVICMTTAFGDTMFLDASRRDLAFGSLSLDCYNGHARVISRNGGPVYLSAQRIKERETTNVFINNETGGKLSGSCEASFGEFKKEEIRKIIKEKGVGRFFEDARSSYPGEMEITKSGIDSLNSPGNPALFHFEFRMPAQDEMIYFNPVIMTEYRQNPLRAEERNYPVWLSFPIDQLYTLNMDIPEGYVVDELPRPAKVSFNGDQGQFEYGIQAGSNSIQFRTRVRLNEVYIAPSDYRSLRDFFGFIVKKLNEQVVFRKKK